MYFLTQSLKVDPTTTWLLIGGALVIGTPFFVFFGWLSDRIGRKKIIMAGCLVAALTYIRSEEHTSELQSLMRTSYAVFCLKKKIYYSTHNYNIKYRTSSIE